MLKFITALGSFFICTEFFKWHVKGYISKKLHTAYLLCRTNSQHCLCPKGRNAHPRGQRPGHSQATRTGWWHDYACETWRLPCASFSRHSGVPLGTCSTSSLEKAMVPHFSTLARRIPWTEEPGRLQSMGLLRVGHD